MTKRIKYPMEAFAFAMVLFSTEMKMAMIVGIGLIFGDVLQCVLWENHTNQYAQTIRGVGAALTCGAIYLMCTLVGITPDVKQVLGLAVLGLLLMKHSESRDAGIQAEGIDYNGVLLADAAAYGFYVLLAVIREYFLGATIFGSTLPEIPLISASFGKTMFALIGAGIVIAIINRILKSESESNAALWVCIPTILLEVSFVWKHVPELAGTAVGIAAVLVIYLTFRKKLVFSNTDKHIQGVPVEMALLGMVYMIFSLL